MTVKSAEVKFRTSPQVKREAKAVYDSWGLSLSEALNLFMRKSIEVGGLPFDLRPSAKLDLSRVAVIKSDPDIRLTVLPAEANALEDEGLYDDLV